MLQVFYPKMAGIETSEAWAWRGGLMFTFASEFDGSEGRRRPVCSGLEPPIRIGGLYTS